MHVMEYIAKNAYEAYGESTGYKNHRGEPMPAWHELGIPIQKAWKAAVRRVLEISTHEER